MISSAASAAETFAAISSDPTGVFKIASFYVFFYDFDSRCVYISGYLVDETIHRSTVSTPRLECQVYSLVHRDACPRPTA